MNYTIVGDPHATRKSLPTLELLCEQVETLGNPVIWLGDMLDTKSVISGNCLNFWHDYFVDSSLEHHVLVGNHDYFNLECNDHSLKTLGDLPQVTIHDEPTSLMMQDDVAMLFLPYIDDEQELLNILDQYNNDHVVFAHLEVAGFDYGNGLKMKGGVTVKELLKFKRVISGHIHMPQHKGSFRFLGSPFSKDFGESNQQKCIAVYNTRKNNLTLIPTNLPQHRTIELDCDSEFCDLENLKTLDPSDYYRFILTGTQENINNLALKKYLTPEFLALNTPKIIQRPTGLEDAPLLISDTASPQMQFSTWAGDVSKLSPNAISLGLEILEEVS